MIARTLCTLLLLASALCAGAAEFKMYDGKRFGGLVEKMNKDGSITVQLFSGETRNIPLPSISSIYFSGRSHRFIESGQQKFIFCGGGWICGIPTRLEKGEILHISSPSLGKVVVPLERLYGWVALTLSGYITMLAEDLVGKGGAPRTPEERFLDRTIDRRGVPYAGVVERFNAKNLLIEHDEHLQMVRIGTFKIGGCRLAEAARKNIPPINPLDQLYVGVECRDRSYVIGTLTYADPFAWKIRPVWDTSRNLLLPTSEILRMDVIGGKTVYLARLDPVQADEKTIMAPPQPFRRNSNVQGETMRIGGFAYYRGIGVHAFSSLTFDIQGKFKRFLADVGVDERMKGSGSVRFVVKGDGKVLYTSPVIRGKTTGGGVHIDVPVEGIKKLTITADPTDDLDQSDIANWGAVRLVR